MVPTRTPYSTRVFATMFRHPDDPPAGDPPAGNPADPPLGEPGKAALDAERKARRDAEKAASAAAAELERLRAEADELRAKAMTDQERQLAEARAQIEADVRKTVGAEAAEKIAAAERRVLEAGARAAAAGKLANPADVTLFLNLDDLDRDDQGLVSDATIGAAIDALLAERPYLAATVRNNGTADHGYRRDAPADLKDRAQLDAELAKHGVRARR